MPCNEHPENHIQKSQEERCGGRGACCSQLTCNSQQRLQVLCWLLIIHPPLHHNTKPITLEHISFYAAPFPTRCNPCASGTATALGDREGRPLISMQVPSPFKSMRGNWMVTQQQGSSQVKPAVTRCPDGHAHQPPLLLASTQSATHKNPAAKTFSHLPPDPLACLP